VSYLQLKELLQACRVLLHRLEIARGMLVIIPTVTLSNDLQFLLMKIRDEHKWLDIPISIKSEGEPLFTCKKQRFRVSVYSG